MNTMHKHQIYILSFLLLSFLVCVQCSNKPSGKGSSGKKPNIIILFTDDMGYGDLQDYGNPNIRTPHIDSLADQGIRFTSYEAAPWCEPSRAELMTGLYFPRIKFGGPTYPIGNFGGNGHGGLPDSILTLAEGLKKAGYATGMAGKWHLGYNPKKYLPTNQGFDSWLGLPYSQDYRLPYWKTHVPVVMYRDTTVIENPVNIDSLTVKYTAEALRFIKAHSGGKQPFFFYLAYNMPHLPIGTTRQFVGKSGFGLYADVIETIDWSVGKVLSTLKKEGLTDNTIVFFASDNGPWSDAPPRMFKKPKNPDKYYNPEVRGVIGNKPWHTGSAGPLRGAKATTWEGGTRVPAMIRWPGHIKPHQVTSGLIDNMDIFRTLLQAGGGKLPKYRLDGKNMMPWLEGKVKKSPQKMYAYFYGGLQAMRVGKWKLKLNDKVPELYNLDNDVGEKYNVAAEHPELVKKIRSKMNQFAHEIGVRVSHPAGK